jgi:8-oxo-dGTP pyrophosphatase MutT (NUDIX family)
MDALFRFAYRTAYRGLRLWWRVRRPHAQGVAVAVWHGGRLLVLCPSYRMALDLPGGGRGWGEAPCAAALRELDEETGLRPLQDELGDGGVHTFAEDHRTITMQVFVWRPPRLPMPVIDHREIVWFGWRTPEELAGLSLTGGLRAYLTAVAPKEGQVMERVLASPQAGCR